MFKSEASSFNIVDATPFKRDVLKELADACREAEMPLGFYYSQAQDWCHPGGSAARINKRKSAHWDPTQDGGMDDYIDRIAVPQVRELLSNYGEFPTVLWWDTPIYMNQERATKLDAAVRELKPNIITNNRLGGGFNGDTETLIRNLIDIASKGGNYLLNVGPDGLGKIPAPSVQSLETVGAWMKVNGKVSRAYLLADREMALSVKQHGGHVEITRPSSAPDPLASVLCLELPHP